MSFRGNFGRSKSTNYTGARELTPKEKAARDRMGGNDERKKG